MKNVDNKLIFKVSKQYMFMIAKYLFSIVLILMSFLNHGNKHYLATDMLELLAIVTLSNMLMNNKGLGQIVNNVLILLLNVQLVVLYFGNSYISMIMLSNLHSLEDITGKMPIYLCGVVLVFVFSFLPIAKVKMKKAIGPLLLCCFLGLEFLITVTSTFTYSPLYSYYDITRQHYEIQKMNEALRQAEEKAEEEARAIVNNYYNEEVEGYREKDSVLVEQPNVILIFTEGLSQNIISDKRNIMSNIAEYQQKSLSFDNYFNHTAATYRGLSGQLYSGYQLEDFDSNELISIQSILSAQGYNTFFLNTEPHNEEWTDYLREFKFDELLIDTNYECNGVVDTISDKDAYDILFETAEIQNKTGEPFFGAIYTFGTHASFDSAGERFGDGSEPALNKFYNVDYQFGAFMDKFEESSLADNTIIIFTADHATYQDNDFSNAFPEYYREAQFLDEIPLFVYYKGIAPEVIDVEGRNTINLAPTILDYLDVSAPNYFLGTSLFAPDASSIAETGYTDTYVYLNTKNSQVNTTEGDELQKFKKILEEYFFVKNYVAEEENMP